MKLKLELSFDRKTREFIQSLFAPVVLLVEGGELTFSFEEGDEMKSVADDHADVAFTISGLTVKDSEGNEITGIVEEFISDNPDVVSIAFDSDGIVRSGNVHFGKPGIANLNYTATLNGTIVKAAGEQFVVTTGAPASVDGGEIQFSGLE